MCLCVCVRDGRGLIFFGSVIFLDFVVREKLEFGFDLECRMELLFPRPRVLCCLFLFIVGTR